MYLSVPEVYKYTKMAENKPKDIRRREILDAAMKCFMEKGLHDTRIDDIAIKAKLTKGGVYWHFKDKQEIYIAMIEKHLEDDLEFWEKTVSAEEIGPDSIIKAGLSYIRYSMHNRGHLYLHAEMIAESFRDEILKEKLNIVHRKWRMMIGDFFLSILKKTGKKIKSAEVKGISCILLSCIEGITHQYWLCSDDMELSSYENAWIMFSTLLLRGL